MTSRGLVSIHACHYWRARLGVRINAISEHMFQSTPAITGGRDTYERAVTKAIASFNPRPPLLAGETMQAT